MTTTTRLGLPLLAAAQAQKHITHNEALVRLDDLIQAAVESRSETVPPSTPDEGVRYIVADSATGLWSGHDGKLAVYHNDAWQFYEPWQGFTAYIADEEKLLFYNGADFNVLESGGTQELEYLGLRTTADNTNPLSAKINNALFAATTVAEGGSGDLRYTLSKEAAGNILSFLFQTNYSARAEFGLIGDNHFHIKTSPDGSTYHESLRASCADGVVTFPSGVSDLNNGQLAGLRNILINGGMKFWERGASWSVGGNIADDQYGFDRWNLLCQTTSATGTVTFTNGSSAVGWTAHNRIVGDALRLTTTGSLPTNFSTSVIYYVASVTNANTITLTATPGGTAIAAGSAGSGAHTATSPSLSLSQLSDVENGTLTMQRITTNVSTSQRFGIQQIVESHNCKHLRGQGVTLSARVRSSNSTTLRYAVLEWTGTADAVTSDVVNDWTNSTFTGGNFFNSSNLTIAATGSQALTANTLTSVKLNATLGSSLNNLIVFFWTDSAQAQNSTFDISNVQLEIGSVATIFERRPYTLELNLCQRYCYSDAATQAAYNYASGLTYTTTLALAPFRFPVTMRASPTASYGGLMSDYSVVTTSAVNPTAIGFNGLSKAGCRLDFTISAATAGVPVMIQAFTTNAKFLFDAEL